MSKKNSMKTEIKTMNPEKMLGRANKLMSTLLSKQAQEKKEQKQAPKSSPKK